jgi:hypothetical protein
MSNELRFSDLISEQQSSSAEGVAENSAAQAMEGSSVDTESVAIGSEQPIAQEQVAPSQAVRVQFEDILKERGFKIEDSMDPAELYSAAVERIAVGTQALQENERLRAELERLKSPQPAAQAAPELTQQPSAQPTETVAEQQARLFRELKEYDQTLLQYVSRSSDTGRVIPRPEFGQIAIEAAKVINDYEIEEHRQGQLLLRNPALLIKEHMSEFEKIAREEAQRAAEAKFNEWQQLEQQRTEQEIRQLAEQEQMNRLHSFHEENKAKLFNLDPNGEPLRMPFGDNQYSHTPTGRYFRDRLQELRAEAPGVDNITLMRIAMREAELAIPASSAAPVVPPQQAQPAAVQKQRMADLRQPVAQIPNQNTPVASAQDYPLEEGKLRFADLARKIPENQSRITAW